MVFALFKIPYTFNRTAVLMIAWLPSVLYPNALLRVYLIKIDLNSVCKTSTISDSVSDGLNYETSNFYKFMGIMSMFNLTEYLMLCQILVKIGWNNFLWTQTCKYISLARALFMLHICTCLCMCACKRIWKQQLHRVPHWF